MKRRAGNAPAIKLASRIGFCFGVKRAIDMVERELGKKRCVYSLGSVIHNRQVVRSLADKGLKIIGAPDEMKRGVLVISSHGISPKVYKKIAGKDIRITDTTCPFVRKAQEIAKGLNDAGYEVVIIGDAGHPEVKALVDFVAGAAHVVKDDAETRRLKLRRGAKVGAMSQTTQSRGNFARCVKAIAAKDPGELKVCDTICRDAETRQAAAMDLARAVDVMLVVGGHESANTRRLFEVCKKISRRVHLVETEGEVRRSWFKGISRIGITSGASTPDWVIAKVIDRINPKSQYPNPK